MHTSDSAWLTSSIYSLTGMPDAYLRAARLADNLGWNCFCYCPSNERDCSSVANCMWCIDNAYNGGCIDTRVTSTTQVCFAVYAQCMRSAPQHTELPNTCSAVL